MAGVLEIAAKILETIVQVTKIHTTNGDLTTTVPTTTRLETKTTIRISGEILILITDGVIFK